MKLGYDDLIRNWLKARLNHMKLGYDDLIRKYVCIIILHYIHIIR
jgi:hypothetical protein